MSAVLTYQVRRGQLSAVAGGKVFHLPVYQVPARVAAWEKVQELKSGKVTLWDHCFEPPQQQARREADPGRAPATNLIRRLKAGGSGSGKFELYDFPGQYAQRFEGVSKGPHGHAGPALYVGDQAGGIYIHGWPPCNFKRCIVVTRQWEDLWRAISDEKELKFAIERPPASTRAIPPLR